MLCITPWSRGLTYIALKTYYGMRRWFNTQWGRNFLQYMESVTNQRREYFRLLLVFIGNFSLENEKRPRFDLLTTCHTLTGWRIFNLYLWTMKERKAVVWQVWTSMGWRATGLLLIIKNWLNNICVIQLSRKSSWSTRFLADGRTT